MSIAHGYVRLHREILTHLVFADAELFKLFAYCVLRANHKPAIVAIKSGRGTRSINVARGEFVTGRRTLAIDLQTAKSTIHERLARLAELGCVEILPDTQFSLIRIVNYDIYQPLGDESRTQTGHPSGHQTRTAKDSDSALGNSRVSEFAVDQAGQPKKSKSDTNKKVKQEINTLFEKWWQNYPKKVAKAKADGSFRKALQKILSRASNNSFEFLLDRTIKFGEARIGQPMQYTPHPATWLNGDQFDDDPESWRQSPTNGHAPQPTLTRL